ncbi:MAG: rod-binding protein [Treponema sp.]|jgi:flagellar protein FlgJ|nr:rod-binding protein [Treponema sp.]
MAIEPLGSLHYERAGGESVTQRARLEADTGTGRNQIFAEMLERTMTHEEETPRNARGSSRKPVVDKTDKLYEQCEALETFLIKNLLNSMRSTVQKTGLIDEGFAGKMYEDMLYDAYAQDFTKQANFGLAELAYLELTGQRK